MKTTNLYTAFGFVNFTDKMEKKKKTYHARVICFFSILDSFAFILLLFLFRHQQLKLTDIF